ncbi:MAG TPA: CCA tRNA nucleotidyltransferase [Chthoniobacteraceae bacterium]|nr:CCA tRNA nucleotidyltransferase [Chthoniobacteraceae bacterium]
MSDSLESTARQIVQRLRDAGHVAYYAGGCVRDMLRGVPPQDYDVATSAHPNQVQQLFRRTYDVGAHFGVIVVHDGGHDFEVATFRSDGAYVDGRRPETVTFSSPEEDASRRDFTVNGMFFDPLNGAVIDYVGGADDLIARRLRAIGDPVERFREDRLRMLRAVRFATVLGYEIDPATWDAVCNSAVSIHEVSAERIRIEFVKTLVNPNRLQGFDLLDRSGLLDQIIPEFAALKGCTQPEQFHPEGDVFVHTRAMVGLLPPVEVSVPLIFSVLLHDIAKPPTRTVDSDGRIRFNGHDKLGARMTEEIMERLRFSRAEIEATVEAVDQHMVFKDVQNMRIAKLKRFMARPNFEDEMELHRVDCTSSHGYLDNYEYLRSRQHEFASEPLIPAPLVTGNDLIALGLRPGPRFKEILEAVQSRQLEGTLISPEEALNWVKEEFASNNS